MSDLSTLTAAFDALDIEYAIRQQGEYKFLFIGERRDLHSMSDGKFNSFDCDDIDTVARRHKYFEFENDKLVSYFNS